MELAGEELEKVMSIYDFMYTLVHMCEIFKEYLVSCLPHPCERIWHWMMSSMHICLSCQAYILSSEKTEFNPWSSLAIQTSLITKSLVPITPSLQNQKIWLSEMTVGFTDIYKYICKELPYVCVCLHANIHTQELPALSETVLFHFLYRCRFLSGKLCHPRESFEALGHLGSSLASLMMGYRVLSS